ncbi:MAG: hypothetical protein M3N95_07705 [Actinomycetota bacterium]|nr:hypothetical protein [Actinomycetota bacterium]
MTATDQGSDAGRSSRQEDLEAGIVFTDGAMWIRRLPWMTDKQWTFVRTEMTEWWKAEVVEPLVQRRSRPRLRTPMRCVSGSR